MSRPISWLRQLHCPIQVTTTPGTARKCTSSTAKKQISNRSTNSPTLALAKRPSPSRYGSRSDSWSSSTKIREEISQQSNRFWKEWITRTTMLGAIGFGWLIICSATRRNYLSHWRWSKRIASITALGPIDSSSSRICLQRVLRRRACCRLRLSSCWKRSSSTRPTRLAGTTSEDSSHPSSSRPSPPKTPSGLL